MTHTKGNVIQYNEYYPFGMQTANSWTRENTTSNNFLANGGTELNTTSNLYDLAYRNYDPVLGRMNGVDPMASKYSSLTPYNFSFNDPVTFADPSGADPADYYFYGGYFTYDDWIPQRNLGWQTSLDRSGAGGREFGQSLSSFGGGGYWYGDLNLDLNAMADGAHFFGFSNGLLTSHTHLSPTEVLGLGSAYNEAFVGGTTGPILSNFTGGPSLWQGSRGDYVTFSGGVAMVPGSNVTYSSYLAARSVESSSGDNWFNEHFYFEQQVRVSGGLQATLVPTKEGLLVLPYSSGNEYLSISIDAGSRTLMDVTGNNVSGASTTTYENNVMTYGIGISYKGGNLNFQNTYDGTGESRWNTSLTFGRAGLGVGLSSDGYFSIGSMMQNKWALGLGAEYNLTQTFRFKIF